MGLADRLFGRARSVPSLEPIALDAPELFDDPWPLYSRLRREAPIVPVRSGGYLLTRHADVRALLTNEHFGNTPSRFSALHPRFRETRVAADLAANILPFLDPPKHTESRKLLASALRARLVDFTPEVEALADHFVDTAPDEGFELIQDVAAPFTRAVMCRLIGLPEENGPGLAELTDHFFRLFAPLSDAELLDEVNRGLTRFRALMLDGLGDAPHGSLLGLLREAASGGSPLTEAEIVDSAILVFADGVENVATGVAAVALIAHRIPDVATALHAGGDEAVAAVSEVLRLESPAQTIPRIARRDTEVLGQHVRAGVPVFLSLGSANRDDAAFEDADRFRLGRARSAVLTFGAGRHFCLGAGLAEDQIRALAQALVRAGWDVSEPGGGVRYRRRIGHRWIEALPVRRPGSGQTTR